jgi:DNA repair exonuclease SbcCD ATPase subunit
MTQENHETIPTLDEIGLQRAGLHARLNAINEELEALDKERVTWSRRKFAGYSNSQRELTRVHDSIDALKKESEELAEVRQELDKLENLHRTAQAIQKRNQDQQEARDLQSHLDDVLEDYQKTVAKLANMIPVVKQIDSLLGATQQRLGIRRGKFGRAILSHGLRRSPRQFPVRRRTNIPRRCGRKRSCVLHPFQPNPL